MKEKDIIDFFIKIEKGEILIKPLNDPKDIYVGNISYEASNGWEFKVYNDANSWDYIDFLKSNEGDILEYEDLDKFLLVRNYCPPDEIAYTIYKIPRE